MKIVLALLDEEIQGMTEFAVESKWALQGAGTCQVFKAKNCAEATELIEKESQIDLVIADLQSPDFEVLGKVLRAKQGSIPCVICSNKPQAAAPNLAGIKVVGFAKSPDTLQEVSIALDCFFNEALKKAESSELDSEGESIKSDQDMDFDFCRIEPTLLAKVSPLKANIFIRLSAKHYVRIFSKDDHFESIDIKRFVEKKKIMHLYLKNTETSEFLNKFKSQVDEAVATAEKDPKKSEKISETVHETIHEMISRVGFTPQIQELTKSIVMITVKTMAATPRLRDYLQRLQATPDKYISAHSLLLSKVSCAIASGVDWRSVTTFHKLCFAALLHDIMLSNHKLAMINTLSELEERKSEFTAQEVSEYKFHPLRASEVSQKIPEIAPDVDTIIAQHHEQPDGSGFPRGLTHLRIAPLAALFIVSHDLVHNLILQGNGFNLSTFIAEREKFYTAGNFAKVFKSIYEVTGKL